MGLIHVTRIRCDCLAAKRRSKFHFPRNADRYGYVQLGAEKRVA